VSLPILETPTARACAASWITVLFSGALLLLRLSDWLHEFFRTYSSLPLDQWAVLSYAFWLLGLLWVADRDLRRELSQHARTPALAHASR
jgi:hypothetical protein